MKIFLYLFVSLILISCLKLPTVKDGTNDDFGFAEACYDGVVYLSNTLFESSTVKFNHNGLVATTTSDGKVCKPH